MTELCEALNPESFPQSEKGDGVPLSPFVLFLNMEVHAFEYL